ncbi:ATP-binding protein [Terrisporobacter mayombei]|uniref:histidine kinase n=1 Tax=Terrisporobacter mayombei TaxID=1541 RepID=A0ABY9Q1D4_9FIRM|nr:ATP-binding protein [Terrisporobacter mayombei]MCC3866850.1 PAS domain S-box protein [Terrisporobacter mayombei]WMT81090.1 Adaptive-response sensory-kinase SasA [Terrisporobacter mayombei]
MLSIYNKISDYIIVLSCTGKIIFCNESLLKRLNYNIGDILDLNILEVTKSKENNVKDRLIELEEMNITLDFYTKSNELVKINSNIIIEYFNNEKSIFIIGKEVDSKSYTMEMLEDLLDNIKIAAFITNEDGKYLYANKSFNDIFNLTREDIIGSYNSYYFKDEICKEIEVNNREVLNNKSPKIFNQKLVVNENVHWYKSYKCPLYDKNNRFKYIVAIAENISLAKAVSEEVYKNFNRTMTNSDYNDIKHHNADLNKILSNIGECILDCTQADGLSILMYDNGKEGLIPFIKLKNANKHLKNIKFIPCRIDNIYSEKYKSHFNTMYSKGQISNLPIYNQICIEGLDYAANYRIELSNEFIGIITLSYISGNSPKYNSDEYMKHICNKIAMIIKNIRLSNQVFAENKMRKYTEIELEQYLKVSADLVSMVGKDGYFKRVSPNWYKVLGWKEEELLSMPIDYIVHPKEAENFRMNNSRDNDGDITRHIIRFRHKNGHYVHLEWSSMYISNQGVYVTAARDITKNLEIEREKRNLEEAVQLEIVKNEFFSNMSHEFRTPINILIGTMQLINKNIEQNNLDIENLKKHLNYIKQNSYRLLRLVNNLIDISKMDTGVYELRSSNQNIINVIEDITVSVADYTKDNKINLIFDTNVEELITCCDPDKIERIMLNLLSNAIKYTPENGYIEVDINATEKDVIISVKDTGTGIPDDKLDIIFDRFGQVDGSFNRMCEGSGIGLSLVKNLVEMHGGKINVTSKVNEGSKFTFNIPIKLKEENNKDYDFDRKFKHVERCDIEFSDIYSV